MSKSDADRGSRIELTDSADEIAAKLLKAVTDGLSPHITYEPDGRPGIANLLHVHAAFTGESVAALCEQSARLDTVGYKRLLGALVAERLAPVRAELGRLRADPGYLDAVLATGAQRAARIARDTYGDVRRLVGLAL